MTSKERRELERSIHECLQRGDRKQAAELGIRGYGPEILKLLGMELQDPTAVQDVFGTFCENLWKGLTHFRGDSMFRTWAYCVARRTAINHLRSRTAKRENLHGSMSSLDQEQDARSSTKPWFKTDIKTAFADLRQRLSQEDQELLFLRIDRQLAWDEVAYILADEGTSLSADELRKRSSVLRKRFQHLKELLRQMAATDGLLPQSHA